MKQTIRIEISANQSVGKTVVANHLQGEIMSIGKKLDVIIDVIHEKGSLRRYESGSYIGMFADIKSKDNK